MYKILNSQGLGISGRQNELIELALTHKFNGVEVDMDDLVGRHDALGKQFACQFLQSANIDVGTFCLSIDFGSSDDEFAAASAKLDTICDLGQTLGAKRCYVKIEPASNLSAFQENFEQHRARLYDVAQKFNGCDIKIGLALQAAPTIDHDRTHKFIQTAEEILTLVRTVGHDNIGLCLDTWQWVAGGGAMDQLSEVKPDVLTEVRMADMAPPADPSQPKSGDRTLPGEAGDSLAARLMEHLKSVDYGGPVSVSSDISMFSGASRDDVVGRFSRRLDQLIAGQSIADESTSPAAAASESETANAEAVATGSDG